MRVVIQEEAAEREKRFVTRKQVAWMICEYSKASDTYESVLDFNEILKVKWKNDNIQLCNTRWDETIIATKKQTENEILEKLCCRQESEQLLSLLSLYIRDTVRKGDSRNYTRLGTTVVRYLEQKFCKEHFSARERQLEMLASGAAAAEGTSKGKTENQQWRFCTMDNKRSVLSRRQVWNETRSREKATIQRKR